MLISMTWEQFHLSYFLSSSFSFSLFFDLSVYCLFVFVLVLVLVWLSLMNKVAQLTSSDEVIIMVLIQK